MCGCVFFSTLLMFVFFTLLDNDIDIIVPHVFGFTFLYVMTPGNEGASRDYFEGKVKAPVNICS